MNLIPNAQEYLSYRKFVSIHSEDRDITKHPNSSEFDIELPEDIINVSSARLSAWTFPSNYNTFNASNVRMTFKIVVAYNPGENDYSSPVDEEIFSALYLAMNYEYEIVIDEGFYDPEQMATTLTNKFNEAVSNKINMVYDRFRIVYNPVSQKIWFGNTADQFLLTNNQCKPKELVCGVYKLPEYINWGLPYNLGLPMSDVLSSAALIKRFYHEDDAWLQTDLPSAQVYFVEPPYKVNMMGPSCFYMEIEGLNCIDETSPYNLSKFTKTNSSTNGCVNAAFAKIPVPSVPLSQWFDRDSAPYKIYTPPADRIRKLRIRLRYHNGQLVNFGVFDYTFTLEFSILQPQQNRSANIRKI
jgi:hypothetical protein